MQKLCPKDESDKKTYAVCSGFSDLEPIAHILSPPSEERPYTKGEASSGFKQYIILPSLERGKYTVAPVSSYAKPEMDQELSTIWSQVTTAIKTGSWQAMYANHHNPMFHP